MNIKNKRLSPELFYPRHWLSWFGIGILRIISLLPYQWMKKCSVLLGSIFFKLAKSKRHVIETNIDLCFPDKTKKEKADLSLQSSISTLMAIFEVALAWWGSKEKLSSLHTVEGMEHLEKALEEGKGAILLVSHFTTMEIAGAFLNSHIDNLKVVYKPSHHPVLEYFIQKKRLQKCCSGLIKHKKIIEMVRSIKNGNVVWYAPDQDFGYKDSVFAPFMGVMTSTLLSTQRLSKLTGAPVVPFYVARLKDEKGYVIRFSEELKHFPSDDDEADATNINHAIGQQVTQTPEQYLWAHRRFKTRPIGEDSVYTR